MSNNSNAPFVSSKIYPLVAGVSNSPFTDQRAVETGGGSGGLGNVIYNGQSLSVDNGAGSSVITNVDNATSNLSFQNDGGGLNLNATNDNVTLRGDSLLTLTSLLGGVDITAQTTDVNIKSLLGNVKIESLFDIKTESDNVEIDANTLCEIKVGNRFVATSTNESPGEICGWRNVDSTNTLIGSFKMSRGSGTEELLICDGIDIISFAGNNSAIPANITPIFRFNQIAGTDSNIRFMNVPTTINDVLTYTTLNGSVYEVEWKPPVSSGSDITYSNNQFINNDTTPSSVIQSFGTNESRLIVTQQGGSNTEDEWANIRRGAGATESFMKFRGGTVNSTQTVPPSVEFRNIFSYNFCGRDGFSQSVNNPAFALRKENNQGTTFKNIYFTMGNIPSNTSATDTYKLTTQRPNTSTGLVDTPYNMRWELDTGSSGTANSNLVLNYDTTTSTLILSDPADNLPVISTTQVVPGRTVLIKDVVVNGTTELSALGLSNSIFPPPLEGQANYWDGLIGNSPPRVSLNPTTGLTNWFVGASFKITLAGEITYIGGYDDITLKVYSNRGQPSQNILNSFKMITRTVDPPPKVGWNWVIDFTCRSINDGGILGVIATSSAFNYTDDTYILENLGAIVSNTNSSFDTSLEQFLDCTIEFDYYNNSNNIKTTLCTIERIF